MSTVTRRTRWLVVAAAVFAALFIAVAIALATPTWWALPMLQHQVKERSGRVLAASALRFGLTRDLQPTLSFTDLKIENAPWADARPFVRAGTLRLTFAWRSLTRSIWIITRLDLIDAELDMELRPDGLRNWRLWNPDDRGPGRVRVYAVDATRSRLRLVHGPAGIVVDTSMQPLPDAERATLPQAPELPLTKRFAFEGTRHGQPFQGSAQISDVLTFLGTDAPFAVSGALRAAGSSLAFRGRLTDVAHIEHGDLALRLTSSDLSGLRRLLPDTSLPALAVSGSAMLRADDGRWAFSAIDAVLGHTDIAGTFDYTTPVAREERADLDPRNDRDERAAHRPQVQARLTSRTVHTADLRGWSSARAAATPLDALQRVDATVDLRAGQLIHPGAPPSRDLRVQATLAAGDLQVASFAARVAGGQVSGHARATLSTRPPVVSLRLNAADARLEQITASPFTGTLKANADLQARGASIEALLASLGGRVAFSLVDGTLPKALDAKLALDGAAMLGAMVGAMVAPGARVPLRCAAAAFELAQGDASVRELVLETDRAIVVGSGRIGPARGTLDLRFTPHLKQVSPLALRRAIRVSGALREPEVTLIAPGEAGAVAGCAPAAVATAASR